MANKWIVIWLLLKFVDIHKNRRKFVWVVFQCYVLSFFLGSWHEIVEEKSTQVEHLSGIIFSERFILSIRNQRIKNVHVVKSCHWLLRTCLERYSHICGISFWPRETISLFRFIKFVHSVCKRILSWLTSGVTSRGRGSKPLSNVLPPNGIRRTKRKTLAKLTVPKVQWNCRLLLPWKVF